MRKPGLPGCAPRVNPPGAGSWVQGYKEEAEDTDNLEVPTLKPTPWERV